MPFILILMLTASVTLGIGHWYLSTENICPVPISYRVGEIDPRFAVTEEEAKQSLLKAESVWEEPLGRELFVYDENSTFALNLIYDERQQLASTEEEWRLALDAKQAEGLNAIEKVKIQSQEYESEQEKYQENRISYENRLASYNKEVEKYNQQGGAPEDVYQTLQKEQAALTSLLNDLVDQEKELNKKIDEINRLGTEGNRLINLYNEEVLKYNEIYGSIDIYTQGDFKKDRINVYKFSDIDELTKVIAHEFGHALGIGHVDGGESIMYYLMEEQPDSLMLSQEDLKALIAICGSGTDFASKVRGVIRDLLKIINQ